VHAYYTIVPTASLFCFDPGAAKLSLLELVKLITPTSVQGTNSITTTMSDGLVMAAGQQPQRRKDPPDPNLSKCVRSAMQQRSRTASRLLRLPGTTGDSPVHFQVRNDRPESSLFRAHMRHGVNSARKHPRAFRAGGVYNAQASSLLEAIA